MKSAAYIEQTDSGYPVPVDGIPLIRLNPEFVPFSRQEPTPFIARSLPDHQTLEVQISEPSSVSV